MQHFLMRYFHARVRAYRRRHQVAVGLATLLATLLAITSGCTAEPTDRRLERGTNPGTQSSSRSDTAPGAATKPSTKPSAVILGDLDPPPSPREVGAPYDPCTVVSWASFPQTVRPDETTASKPTRRTPGKDAVFRVACVWANSGKIVINPNGQPPAGNTGMFSVWIVWGDEMTADPAKIETARPAQFGRASGAIKTGKGTRGEPMCITYAQLAKGVGAVSTLNSRFAGVDPCAVSTAILTEIANKHG